MVKKEDKKNKTNTKEKLNTETEKESEIQKNLINIYKDESGMPDMSKLEKKKKNKTKTILIYLLFFLFILSAAAWAGFFIFGGTNKFTGQDISLGITAPQKVSSGEEISYVINYKNREKTPISRAEVRVEYPKGFIFKEASPEPSQENNIWLLGTLPSGNEGVITITGQLLGDLDSEKSLEAYLNYRPANFNSDFQEVASASSTISSSVADIELEAEDQIIAGESTDLLFNVKNTTENDLKDIRVGINLPKDFNLEESNPEKKDDFWIIDSLLADKEQEIELTGAFSSEATEEKEITVRVETKGENDIWYLQQEKTFLIKILKEELIVNLIINGSNEGQSINFGDTLNYSLVYQNKGQAELKNLTISATIEGNLIDWDSINDDNKGNVKNNSIIWTKEEIDQLEELQPGDEGTIDWQIKIKSRNDFSENEVIDDAVKSTTEIKIGETEGIESSNVITGSTIVNEINSDFSLQAEGRYFNDDNIAVGSGPLPPEVGKTTSYRIFWTLDNSVHEVTDVRVKTILPDNIFWTGKSLVSAGQLNFNVNTREIIWSINRIPTTVKELQANFEVSVTPSNNDANTVITLIPETTAEAIDKKTKAKLFLAEGAITSNLEGDLVGEGRGLVIE